MPLLGRRWYGYYKDAIDSVATSKTAEIKSEAENRVVMRTSWDAGLAV